MRLQLSVVVLGLALAAGPAGCSEQSEDCHSRPLGCPADLAVPDALPPTDALRAADAPLAAADAAGPGSDAGGGVDLGLAPDSGPVGAHQDVPVATVLGWINGGKQMALLDVREPFEFAAGRLAGAQNLAWTSGVLAKSTGALPTDRPLVVYCRSGSRSNAAATFLAEKGFSPVYDMLGGVLAWEAAGYPLVQ